MRKLIKALLCTSALFLTIPVWGIPAKRGVLEFTQPDGKTLDVTLQGDENHCQYMTTDGYLLLPDDAGTLRFADIQDGRLQPSRFEGCRPEARSNELQKWLTTVPRRSEMNEEILNQSVRRMKLPQSGLGLHTTTFPNKGKIKGLVILVEYQNIKFKIENPYEYFSNLLNQKDFAEAGGTGSARDYFLDASLGQFDPDFDVYGPVTLPNRRSYYGATTAYSHDSHPEDMAVHAVSLLDDEVDFSQYDCDGDGVLDNVFIFYAGQGQADGGPAECIWPHAWTLHATGKEFSVDGVLVDRYACANEWQTQNGVPDGIGTFCHEFSHVMGLPDLYSTGENALSDVTPGAWSIMDYGPYNNNSRTPPTYSAYERNAMGWLDVEELTAACTVTLPELQETNKAYLVATENSNEFFLFENRQQTGWDKYIPGHGMLIWHVDFDQYIWDQNKVNNSASHQYVDLVEANGQGKETTGRAWPGSSRKTSYTATTNPAFVDWRNNPIPLPITGIEEINGIITFDVDGGDFVFDIPKAPVASDITPISFILSWDEVERAKSYQISVYTKDREGDKIFLADFEDRDVENGRSVCVEGADADTQYYAAVRAINGKRVSDYSSELCIRTPELSFPYFTPNALPASNLSASAFTANWEPVEGAADYLLTVASSLDVPPFTNTASFGTLTFMLPKGWEFSEHTSRYEDTEYCGKAVPAAKMSTDGSTILTKVYEQEVQRIKFWYRGESTNTQCSLDIDGCMNDKWQTIQSLTSLSREGAEVDITEIPEGVHQVRFVYHRYGNGKLAIDDIEIVIAGVAKEIIGNYSDLAVGNVCSYDVTGLPEDKSSFVYTIQARDRDGRKSLVSAPQHVNLDLGKTVLIDDSSKPFAVSVNKDAIVVTTSRDCCINLYSTIGELLMRKHCDAEGQVAFKSPLPGIYIINCDGKSVKIRVDAQ